MSCRPPFLGSTNPSLHQGVAIQIMLFKVSYNTY